MKTLKFINISFNDNEKNILSLPYRYKNNVAILDKFDNNGVSIFEFKKHSFADRVFTLMLVYRKQSMQMQQFSQMWKYLVARYSIDIVAGTFNYNLLKVSEKKALIFPQTRSGSLIDHVYINKSLMQLLKTCTFLMKLEKYAGDFHTVF